MSTPSSFSGDPKKFYESESSQLKAKFTSSQDGLAYARGRSSLVESIVLQAVREVSSKENALPEGAVLLAVEDFGRQILFPYSEVDLLFLFYTEDARERGANAVHRISQQLGQSGLKTRSDARILAEIFPFHSDHAETVLSLLESRFLAGDEETFARLREEILPEIVAQEAQSLVERLAELTRNRHRNFSNTVFHLVPNVKDGPGGYLDAILAGRLAVISALEERRRWPDRAHLFSAGIQPAMDSALAFFASVRVFLNFRDGGDESLLTWEAQEGAAVLKLGAGAAEFQGFSGWMRIYFHHARAVDHIFGQLLEQMPAAQTLFYRQLETWRTGFADADFSVVDGLIFFQKPESAAEFGLFFRTFLLIAQRGFKLGPAAEHALEQDRAQLSSRVPPGPVIWSFLEELLREPHAADALRAMHSMHLLTLILPEFRGIDALALRDINHRFTVDEHTLQGLGNLNLLRHSRSKWDERFAGVLEELDQPELLCLAILLHDTGKSASAQDHIAASTALARQCLSRFGLPETEAETVLFLVERHLDMAAMLRRDIYDSHAVAQFAESMGAPDRLKMLCLFTYADLKAMNPEALTPWKAEDLWQLYIGAANYMSRSVDERVHADENDEVLNHLQSLANAAGKKFGVFLDGLPKRYLRTHPVDEILRHFEMVNRLGQDPVQLALKRTRHWYELIVVTKDRPRLFATVAGALAACGMNIGKAGAFSNSSGTVVDTFSFTDRFRTLEMNLPAWERFKATVHDVLTGRRDLKRMLRERLEAEPEPPATAPAPLQIQFDNQCSAHSTLIEIVTPDKPGLLYRISSAFSDQNCNIDIALIDTEGQTAIDVFYLTAAGGKLTPDHQARLREALLKVLAG